MITPHWQHFEHKADMGVREADMGVRGFGNEPTEAFEQADQGILIRSSSLRGMAEEAPAAYKDVNDVVKAADQAGLSRMIAKL